MHNSKDMCKIFLYVVIVFLGLISYFNFIVDPYNVFDKGAEQYKPYAYESMRDTLYPKLKMSKGLNPDYVLVSSSNMNKSVSQEHFKRITNGKTLYKIFILSKTPSEDYDIVTSYIKLHPNTKHLYIALDFEHFVDKNENQLPKYNGDNLNLKEILQLLFSLKTTQYSWVTYKEFYWRNFYLEMMLTAKQNNLLNKIPYFRDFADSISFKQVRPKFKFTFFDYNQYNEKCFDDLKRLKKYLDDKNIKVTYLVSPSHGLTLANIYESGYRDEFLRFKKELAEITPYIDFKYINPYSTLPVNLDQEYYTDPFHGQYALGDLIIRKMLNDPTVDFGIWIDKSNVDKVLKREDDDIQKYIRDNKALVSTYMTYSVKDFGYYEGEDFLLK